MKTKQLWSTFVIGLMALLGLEIYQTLNFTDFTTGMETQAGKLPLIIEIGLVLFVFIIMMICKSTKRVQQEFIPRKNIFSGIIEILLFVALIGYAVLEYQIGNVSASQNAIIISGVFSSIVFLLMAFSSFLGKNILEKLPILFVIPIIWMGIRLIVFTFVDYTNVTQSTMTTLMSIAMIFLFMFIYTYAKLITKQSTNKTYKRMFMIGLITAVTTLLYAVPTLIILTKTNNISNYGILLPCVIDILIAMFIISTLIEVTSHISKEKQPEFILPVEDTASPKKEGYEVFDEIKSTNMKERVESQENNKISHTVSSNTAYFDKLVDIEQQQEDIDEKNSTAAKQVVREETISIDKKLINEELNRRNGMKNKEDLSQPKSVAENDGNISMNDIDKLVSEILSEE